MPRGLEHLSYRDGLRELGLKRLCGDLICQYLNRTYRKTGLFTNACSDMTRGNSFELKTEIQIRH